MRKKRTLSRGVLFLFIGYAVNFLGSGMTMPFLMVYLHQVRHISLVWSGIILSASSIAGVLTAPLIGILVDRFGAMRTLMTSVIVLAFGTVGFAITKQVWSALIVSALTGSGNSAMWSGLSTQLARLADKTDRARLFGMSYAVQNLGLGLGSGISGLIVHTNDPLSFARLFLFDGLTYVLFIPFLIPVKRELPSEKSVTLGQNKAESKELCESEVYGYRTVLKDRALLAVTGLNLFFVVFGFSQLSSAFSTWAVSQGGIGTSVIGFAFFANCIGITLLQIPVLHLTAVWRRTRAAAAAGLGFLLCWFMVFVAGKVHEPLNSILLVSALVVFGIGETFLSPSLVPLVNNLAHEAVRGRYNAMYNLSWQVGLILGPLVAGFALEHGSGSLLFLLLALLCGLGGLGALIMERIIPNTANQGEGM